MIKYYFAQKSNILKSLIIFSFLVLGVSSTGFSQGIDCNSSEQLIVNGSCDLGATITNTAEDAPFISNSPTCPSTTFQLDGWYYFDLTSPTDITITATNNDARNLYLQLMSTTGSCVGRTEIACANNFGNNAQTETINATNLSAGTYYIKVADVRNGGSGSGSMTFDICITGIPACNPPTVLAATSISSTSATINWTAASPVPSTGYEYIVSLDNSATTPGDDITGTTTATSNNIAGLSTTTTYYIFVRSDCGSSNYSSWDGPIQFTTTNISTPPNNDCANATSLTVGSSCSYTTYTNLGATDSAETSPSCANYQGSDVWFTITVPASGNVNIDTNTGDITDSGMAVYSGNCGSLTEIDCDDLSSANGLMSYISLLGRTPGETLYIRVWEWGNDVAGTFGICAVDPGIICNEPNITTTTSITSSTATINWTGANPLPANGYEYIISTDNTTTTSGDDITGTTTGTSINLTGLSPNTTYYIFVRSDCGSSTFSTWDASSFSTLALPPSNDDCSGAINLTVNTSCSFSTYTNAGATASTGVPAPGCAFYSGGDVWFSATVPASGNIIIDTDSGVITDSGMAVYSGTCGALNLVECDDDGSANGLMSYIALTGRTPGETLYIRVWEYGNNNNGSFDICVYTPTPPDNDECSNAISITSDIVCNNISGTSSWATQSLAGCTGTADDDVWYSFEATNTEHTVTITDGSIYDIVLEVFSGSCGSLTSLSCTDNNISTGESATLTGLTIGNTYFVRVYSLSSTQSNQGSFEICLTNPIPPGTNGVTICAGDPSDYLTSDILCDGWIAGDDDTGPSLDPEITAYLETGVTYTLITTPYGGPNSGSYTWNVSGPGTTSLTNTISGTLNSSTDPQAFRPTIFIVSSDPCDFSTTLSNYTSVNFTVSVTGTYVFAMASNSIDLMGYIYIANTMTPGECSTTEWYTTQTGGTPIGFGSIFDPVGVSGSGLADTNTSGTYTFWAGCSANSNPREQADFIISDCGCIVWNGSADDDWDNNANWNGGMAPTLSDCVVIPSGGFPIILDGINAQALNITIQSGANITIENLGSLTVQDFINGPGASTGDIILQGSPGASGTTNSNPNNPSSTTFDSSITANLIQINDVINTAVINLQRYVFTRTQDYVYWSSPVEGINPLTNFGTSLVYEWDPTIYQNANEQFGNWFSPTGSMEAGKGYIARGPNGGSSTNIIADWAMAQFFGVPHNGTIIQNLRRGTYLSGNPNANVEPEDDNWNLVGNPYPSNLDADLFLLLNSQTNERIANYINLWSHGIQIWPGGNSPNFGDFVYNYDEADYITYNYLGSSNPSFNGYIGSGQGFFVQMLDEDSANNTVGSIVTPNEEYQIDIEFNNSMRTSQTEMFFRSTQQSENTSNPPTEKHRIWLDLIQPDLTFQTMLVGYIQGATMAKDKMYDAKAGNSKSIYSLISGSEDNFVIQGRALPFEESDIIPLGVKLDQIGEYAINLNSFDGLFEANEQDIFLEDLETGIVHDLRESAYFFTINETGTFNSRFLLRYTNTTLGIDDIVKYEIRIIAPNNEYIKVTSGTNQIESVKVYDLLGRVLVDKQNINATELTINNVPKANGAYIVKAILVNGIQKIQKVVLK